MRTRYRRPNHRHGQGEDCRGRHAPRYYEFEGFARRRLHVGGARMKAFMHLMEEIGRCFLFVRELVIVGLKSPCHRSVVAEQVIKVTWQSLSTTALAGFFVGAIMTVQFTLQVKEFGALGY